MLLPVQHLTVGVASLVAAHSASVSVGPFEAFGACSNGDLTAFFSTATITAFLAGTSTMAGAMPTLAVVPVAVVVPLTAAEETMYRNYVVDRRGACIRV